MNIYFLAAISLHSFMMRFIATDAALDFTPAESTI